MKQDTRQKLQFIFDEPIINVTKMAAGHDNTNDVYAVQTKNGRYIVKIVKDPLMNGTFWKGLNLLFGTTHEVAIEHQQALAEHLNRFICVPQVIKYQTAQNNPLNKPYIVMDMLPGNPVIKDSDIEAHIMSDPDCAYQLGAVLKQIHQQTFSFFGNLELKGFPLSEFPKKLASTIEVLANSKKAKKQKLIEKYKRYYPTF